MLLSSLSLSSKKSFLPKKFIEKLIRKYSTPKISITEVEKTAELYIDFILTIANSLGFKAPSIIDILESQKKLLAMFSISTSDYDGLTAYEETEIYYFTIAPTFPLIHLPIPIGYRYYSRYVFFESTETTFELLFEKYSMN